MAMTRTSKSKRPVPVIRGILGRNVTALRDSVFSELPNVTARNRKLAEAIGSKLSQIQRICNGELGTSIDTVEWLAEALRVRPHDLLTPYFVTTIERERDATRPRQSISNETGLPLPPRSRPRIRA